MARPWLVAVACLLVAASQTPALALSYVDLVLRLIDLEALAVLPAPGEGCLQWSSHDRASRYDACADRYVDWAANDDGDGVIRKEGVSYVLAEMEGPGCIYRIWSANPGEGHVKIFLDGAAEPTVDLPFRAYFDLDRRPFIYRSLVHTAAGGYNCYLPIPFQESCKITAEEGWGDYYHFTYVTFSESESVPTFRRDLSPEGAAALLAVDRFLSNNLGSDPAGRRPGEVTEEVTVTLAPQQEAVAFKCSGERAITGLRVKPLGDVEDLASALREVILKIRWDGEPDPSVWAPLGDFFGTAPGINQYRSLPLGMTDDGFYSLWYMPFAVEALVEVANEGAHPTNLEFSITHAPLSRPIHELGRFHAKWHRDAMLPTRSDRLMDWTILKVQGRGRFCGAMLHVWNPIGGWWGEGDEKFFVDGERLPSTFGTGSEDYFGYAWSNSSLFEHAYHNQTLCENNSAGHVSVNRWQIADNVPFQTSFEGVIEKYFPNGRPTLYACVAYWYQSPDGIDPYGPVPVAQRAGCYNYVPVAGPGAVEGENLVVRRVSGGHVETERMAGRGGAWSGDAQLRWTGARPGDVLALSVTVPHLGEYEIGAQFTRAGDYGIVQLLWDGRELGEPVDLYGPSIEPTGTVVLGTLALTPGEHELAVKVVGSNREAVDAFVFGLDYVKLAATGIGPEQPTKGPSPPGR